MGFKTDKEALEYINTSLSDVSKATFEDRVQSIMGRQASPNRAKAVYQIALEPNIPLAKKGGFMKTTKFPRNPVAGKLYFSTDNGSSYLSSYQDSRHARKSDGTDTHSTSSSTSSMGIIGSYSLGNITGMIFNGKITIFDPLKQSGTTDARTMFTGEIGYGTSDGYITTVNVSAMSNSSTAVNNIKFQINSGNITSGKVSLYGRKIS